jgi:hypothetical protein
MADNFDGNRPERRGNLRGRSGQIQGKKDLAAIERTVNHPDFKFDPVIHENLANELYLVFKDRYPDPPNGRWSERARLMAARIIHRLAIYNLKNQPRRHEHEHKHAHVRIDDAQAAELIEELDRLAQATEQVGRNSGQDA